MDDQATTKEESSDGAHGETTNERKVAQGKAFIKKNFRSNNDGKKNEGVPELLRGVGFTIARDGPDLYLKTMKRLGVYICEPTRMDLTWRCA